MSPWRRLGSVTVTALVSFQMLPWHCCHCCRCGAGIIAALASLQTLPWQSCGPPFMGVDTRLLVHSLFFCLPSAIGARPGLCPFVVHSSEKISLIASASAPAPMAVRSAFLADGARPLVSAFLADLQVRSTPSKAGSLLSSKTLPALFFCQLSWFRAVLFRFWGVTTPASLTPAPASVCNTPQRLLQRGWRLPLGLQCPIAEATTNGKELCASAQSQHIASRNGNGVSYRVAQWRRQQQHGCDNIICCQQAAPCAHAHKFHIAKAMCTSAQAVDTSRFATATLTRPHVQAQDSTLHCTAATATRPRAQAHNNTPRCMAATATRPHVQAHNNTLHCTRATATRPCAQAHDNTLHCTAATRTRTGATKTMKLSTKPSIHVALLDGNNDNNYGNDNDKCWQQGLMRKCTAFSYCAAHMRWRQQQSATTNDKCRTTNDRCRTTRPRTQAHGILAIVRKCTCYVSNIDALLCKRTRLSAIVRKCTSYSVHHQT
jgi:hypothetical protein